MKIHRTLRPLLVACLMAPAALSAQSLSDAVREMLAFEPELLAAHADTHSAWEDVDVARGELRPHLTFNADAGFRIRDRSTDGLIQDTGDALFSRQVSASLRQLLYDGGRSRLERDSASDSARMQEHLERAMIEGRTVDLAEVYQEVLRIDRRIQEAKRNIEIHETIRNQVHQKAAQTGTRADAALVDERLIQARDGLVSQQLAKDLAIARFERLVGHAPQNLARPVHPSIPDSRSTVDLSQNWNYLAAQSALDAAALKADATHKLRSPRVYLDAGASRGEDVLGVSGADNEARALIVASWDAVTGGTNRALGRREEWQVMKAEELFRAADLERNYRLLQLWKEREGDDAAIASLRSQSAMLSRVLKDFEEQFQVGQRELLDLLDLHQRRYETQSRLIDSEFNYNTGAYRILGVQGRLVEYLIGEDIVDYTGKMVITEGGMDVPHPHHEAMHSTHPMDQPTHVEFDGNQNRGILGRLFGRRGKDHSGDLERQPRNYEMPSNLTPVSGEGWDSAGTDAAQEFDSWQEAVEASGQDVQW